MNIDKQIEALLNKIEKDINEALQSKSLEEEIIKVAKHRTNEDVYEAYIPVMYKRTNSLRDKSWRVDKVRENTIRVHNTRTDKGKFIPQTIETGQGYKYGLIDSSRSARGIAGWQIPEPANHERPFIANTSKQLQEDEIVKKAIRRELLKKRYRILKEKRSLDF